MKYVDIVPAIALGMACALAAPCCGVEMFGADFSDQELTEWHARIAVRYGVAGDELVEFKKAAFIKGDILMALDERTILVQPASGEPVALTVCSNAPVLKSGQKIDRRGIPAGKREYSTAIGNLRTAVCYEELARLTTDRFLEFQRSKPGHAAFAMLRRIAQSRLMTAEEEARKKAAAEQRIQQLNDPRWQKKLISPNSAGSPVQILADPKKPLLDDER